MARLPRIVVWNMLPVLRNTKPKRAVVLRQSAGNFRLPKAARGRNACTITVVLRDVFASSAALDMATPPPVADLWYNMSSAS